MRTDTPSNSYFGFCVLFYSVVKVETIEGEDRYAIFDHVTVGIQLKGECVRLFASFSQFSLFRKV